MRKKVRYSITRYDHNRSSHFSGYGEIDEENLYTKYQNKYGETVEHIYEDCIKDLHPILDKPNQFKGGFFELSEYNGRKVQTDYNIWIKII